MAQQMLSIATLEYVKNDELVEITPTNVRLRKATLDRNLRKRETKVSRTV
jgi:predicted membrane GTPase involved in stress response